MSNFNSEFGAALEEYKKITKLDLATHPFADEFSKCDSSRAILEVFRKQAEDFKELRKGDDRLMRLLDSLVFAPARYYPGDTTGLIVSVLEFAPFEITVL